MGSQDVMDHVKSAEQSRDAFLKEDPIRAEASNIAENNKLDSSLQEPFIDKNLSRSSSLKGEGAKGSKPPLVGDRIRVFWPEEKEWFEGSVTGANASGKCHISYDDGDTEWIILAEQKWELLPGKGQADTMYSPI